jgi:hypothetical protein
MALRSTYNSGVFNSGLYGEPETTQGAASASIGVSASASAVAVVDASSSTSIAFVSSQPTGVRVVDASASVSLGGIANVSAITYEVIPGFRPGYGLNTYGSYIYGENRSTEDASATANITFAVSVAGKVTRNVSSLTAIAFTTTAHGVYDVVASASAAISISSDIGYIRIRNVAISDNIEFTPAVNARYKWEDAPEPTTIWTEASDPSTTWTEASDPSTTWTEADYLERAA